ncbi:hypothetical protein ACOMHN_059378 [Nucella lapillus]
MSKSAKVHEKTGSSEIARQTGLEPDTANQILQALESLKNNVDLVLSDIVDIKSDLSAVRSKCDDIDRRCSQLEKEGQSTLSTLQRVSDNVNRLSEENKANSQKMEKLSSSHTKMNEEISNLAEEVDRGGKLIVQPKPPDQRSYAEVAAANSGSSTEEDVAEEGKKDWRDTGQFNPRAGEQRARCADKDSSLRASTSSLGQQRATHQTSGNPRQTGPPHSLNKDNPRDQGHPTVRGHQGQGQGHHAPPRRSARRP